MKKKVYEILGDRNLFWKNYVEKLPAIYLSVYLYVCVYVLFCKWDEFSNTNNFFVCNLLAMQIFSTFYLKKILLYLKKILLGTSNRSKIFQIVFEIWQIYDKIHLRKCTRSGSKATFKPDLEHFPVAFLREIYYFSKTIWDILDLFEVPKSIFLN